MLHLRHGACLKDVLLFRGNGFHAKRTQRRANGRSKKEVLMWIINREDWDLLQAVKDLGLTVEKVKEMDDPAPLPFEQDECPVNNEDWEGGL